jgi:hypothetical protein
MPTRDQREIRDRIISLFSNQFDKHNLESVNNTLLYLLMSFLTRMHQTATFLNLMFVLLLETPRGGIKGSWTQIGGV